MKDEIKEKLLKEIKKYPKKQNYESGLRGYCLKVIDSTDKLNRFEKKSFSEILSRWVLEAKLQQHEETSKAKDEEKKEFGKYQFNLGVELQKAYDKQEFIKILTKLEDDMDALQINYANLDECKKVDVYELIDKIKKDLKETEE